MDDLKNDHLDKEDLIQFQNNNDNKHSNKQNIHSSIVSVLLPPPLPSPLLLLRFRQQKYDNNNNKNEQEDENKRLENTINNRQNHVENGTTKPNLSNTDKLISYFRQIVGTLKEISLDQVKLQKDYLNTFHLIRIESMKSNVDEIFTFQSKLFAIYS